MGCFGKFLEDNPCTGLAYAPSAATIGCARAENI
jgi:hypothetical protein